MQIEKKIKPVLLILIINLFFIHLFAYEHIKSDIKTKKTIKKNARITLSGRVIYENKKPAESIKVKLNNLTVKTDNNGYFVAEMNFSDKIKIAIKPSKKYYPYKKTVSLKGKNTFDFGTIVLYSQKSGVLRGKIVDTKNNPVSNATIYIPELDLKTKTDAEGIYVINKIPKGTYTVKIYAKGYKKIIKSKIKIKKGTFTTLNITLKPSERAIKIKENKMALEERKLFDDKAKYDESSKGIASSYLAEPVGIKATSKTSKKDYSSKKLPLKDKVYVPTPLKKTNSGLRASFSDDNKQYNYFLDFLKKYKNTITHYDLDVSERFIIKCFDKNGKTLPDVEIKITDTDGNTLENGITYSDGAYLFFSSEYDTKNFVLSARYNQQTVRKRFSTQDKRTIKIKFKTTKTPIQNIPLDLLFIFDTTGSMGEEIARLKATIENINLNLNSFSPKPDIRFGMVLYKDKKDSYDTKIIPFTKELSLFQKQLNKITANGGGDTPEDLQKALDDAVNKMEWRKKSLKLAFIITDAPPHLYKDEKFTYVDAAKKAKSLGLKLFTIGAGGLNITGEYILRQLSQYTYANYVFLTYGEKGESEGGKPGSVSHHTGENFKSDKLDVILIKILKKELKQYSGQEIETDEYFEANYVKDEKKDNILDNLFTQAINQLYDYSTVKIEKDTPTAISPILAFDTSNNATAEYFTQNLQLALVKSKKFKAVERKNLQPILDELKFQLNELSDESKAAQLGKFVGAKLLITGKMYKKNNHYEIFLNLMNVETVEILSVTKLKIDAKLGL